MPRIVRKTAVNGRAAAIPVSHAKTPEDMEEVEATAAPAGDISAAPAPVDTLSELMTSLQGASSARINVYRIVKNQPPSYVFECAPESFSLDELRDKYNGGEFRLYIMKEGRLWKNTRVVVEPRQVINNGVDPTPPTHLFDMMALIRDGFSAQTTALREMSSARGGPSLFANMDLPAVITAAAAAITALRPPPAPAPAADSTSQALDMFMKGMQIAMDVRDNAPNADNSIGGMLRDALRSPVVAAAVQASMVPPPQQAPPPALPPPEVSHAKTAPTTPATPAVSPNADMMRYYLSMLCQKAAANADPTLYAEIVLDNIGDEALDRMLERGPALIDDFIAALPAVAEHRPWFEALVSAINNAMADAPQAEVANANDATPPVVPGNAAG